MIPDWLTHFESILQDAFWLAFISFLFMFLTKFHMSNWWFMPSSFFSSWNICHVLINPFFSVWLEWSTSETWIRDITTILPVSLSINEYVKYFALCPGCHIDHLRWGNSYPFFSLPSKSLLNVEHDFALLCLLIFFLNFIVTCFQNPLNVRQLEKTSNSLVSIRAKKYGSSNYQLKSDYSLIVITKNKYDRRNTVSSQFADNL